MTATHAVKKGRHFRYYTARDLVHGGSGGRRMSRVSMGGLDSYVLAEVPPRLQADFEPDLPLNERVRAAIVRVQVSDESVMVKLHHDAASNQIAHLPGRIQEVDDGVEITLAIVLKHRASATIIESPDRAAPAGRMDRALIRAVALATSWADRLASGDAPALSPMAKAEGYCDRHAGKILPLAWLAPDLLQMILEGRQPRALNVAALTKSPLPIGWEDQRRLFQSAGMGFAR